MRPSTVMFVAFVVAIVVTLGVKTNEATGVSRAETAAGLSFADIARPKPGAWPTYHGNLSGNRFSPLDQINLTTIHSLAPKWMFTIQGAPRPLQMTPVVVDGVMYVTSVNEASALDVRSGRQAWHYSRPRTNGLAGDAATGINRGVAALGDRVFMVTDNAHLIALHRETGELLWDVEMADSRQNYGATGAPLVVNDLVISGVSGGDEGIRGHGCSIGRRAIRVRTTTATSARATIFTVPLCWRSIRTPDGCDGTTSSRPMTCMTGTRIRRRC